MLFKLSTFIALVAPLVSALTVSAPTGTVNNGGVMTITWQTQSGDPASFSVWLTNPSFNSQYAVANTVDASLGTLTIEVPAVPENQPYTVILTPNNDANNILAQSGSFNIGAQVSSSTSATAASTSTVRSGSATGRSTTNAGTTTSRTLPTTSSFGTLVSATAPASSGAASTSAGSAAASATNSSSAALPIRFNMNMGVVASMVLSIVAGAAVVF